MATLVRGFDWSQTALGASSGWSQGLRTTVGLVLQSRFPMLLWWGPSFVQIYNDACAPILGLKHHERALGKPLAECWSEIIDVMGPMIERPFRGGPSTWDDDLSLMVQRRGFVEETHFKAAYSAVPDESVPSGIGGVLATVVEITEEVYGRRQLAMLGVLARQAADAKTPADACERAAQTMEASPRDIPCALFYLLEGDRAALAATAGFSGEEAAPGQLALEGDAPWPLGRVVRERAAVTVDAGEVRLPRGAWAQAPSRVFILPLASTERAQLDGVLVVGLSPHRELDAQYTTFLELAADHVASGIRTAVAYRHERERLYRHFMQAPFPVAILRGPEFVVELANESIVRNWGKGPEVVGLPLMRAVPELEGQPYLEWLRQVFRTGVTYEGRGSMARLATGPNGELRDAYWNFVYAPLFDARGSVEGVLISAFEVTDHVLAARALEAANQAKDLFLRRAVHLQATATLLVQAGDVETIARLFSEADPSSPLDARGCVIFLRAVDKLSVLAATPGLAAWAQRWDGAPIASHPALDEILGTGKPVWVSDASELPARYPSVVPLSDPLSRGRAGLPMFAGDECCGVFVVTFANDRPFDAGERAYLTAVADLWGQSLHRAHLAAAERDAIQRALDAETIATRKKDEFMAMLGHELRNPLTPIVTATSLIRKHGRASTRELDILDRQSKHIVRLVDDLLDISRITSGKLSLDRAPVLLADVVTQAVESTAPGFEARRVRLHSSVGREPIAVDGDRDRLVQVVTNLLVNATKFTPSGKAVHLTAARDGDTAVVEVRDEGEGIAPALLASVFDIFTQGAQGSDRRRGGLGLGLAIARSIVLAHGGQIEASSPGPGQGATFLVRLPLTADGARAAAASDHPDVPQRTSAKKSVLVVDDNRDAAEMIAEYLSGIGYTTVVALDARQALAALRARMTDLALLDIGLPETDGYELAQAIVTEYGPRAPRLVAITGYAQASDRERALQVGFAEHLPKPVDLPRLATTLRRLAREGQT